MAKYDPNVLAEALRAAGRPVDGGRSATARERKALVEAGLVETGLQALTGGDADSTGFLQQRPSQGWGPVGESVGTDTAQFLRAARKLTRQGFKGSAGALAQAVQRSAFPARYDQRAGDAESLLAGAGGDIAGGRGPTRAGAAAAGSAPWDLGAGSTAGVDVLASALQSQRPVVQSAGVAAPAFSAGPKLPQGYQAAAAGGGPQPKSDAFGDALRAVAASSATDLPAAAASAVQASPQAAAGGSGSRGDAAGGGAGAVDFAAARVGHYKENRGSNRGDELDTLQKRFGLTGQAWCAMFATTAAAHGGASRAVRTPSVAQINTWAREGSHGYQKGLRSDRDAQAGDLITFGNAHVGVVDFVDDKGVHTIEGNTGNRQVDKRVRAFGSGRIARPVYGGAG
jgi:hypothetical protein